MGMRLGMNPVTSMPTKQAWRTAGATYAQVAGYCDVA
jgi:hypothetical protein